jgi:hypothetical protein
MKRKRKKKQTWRGRVVSLTGVYPSVWWPRTKGTHQVYIHRIVAAEKLGRKLRSDEHVHHKDRNPMNWRRANLEVKPRAKHRRLHALEDQITTRCAFCKKKLRVAKHRLLRYRRAYCNNTCRIAGGRHAVWPKPRALKKLIWQHPATAIAKKLGVTSSAVKRYCKRRNILTPPRGYWQKLRRDGRT